MASKLDETIPEDGLKLFAENCVLTPNLLARRLELKETVAEQIFHAYPHDRYEQVYQVLLKWRQSRPQATWKQLMEATDSGVRRVMESMFKSSDTHVTESSYDCKESCSGGTPEDDVLVKRPRIQLDDKEETTETFEEEDSLEESHEENLEVQPSAPPLSLINIAYTGCHGDMNVDDGILTYEDNFTVVLEAIRYETHWHDLGLALKLPAPLLDEIQSSYRGQITDCRKEMLKLWLTQRGSTRPSWRVLCQALRSTLVGNNSLANQIARKHYVT